MLNKEEIEFNVVDDSGVRGYCNRLNKLVTRYGVRDCELCPAVASEPGAKMGRGIEGFHCRELLWRQFGETIRKILYRISDKVEETNNET